MLVLADLQSAAVLVTIADCNPLKGPVQERKRTHKMAK